MSNTFSVESILFKDINNNSISNTNIKVSKSIDDCVYDAYKSSEDLKFYETYTMINDYNTKQKLRMLNKLRNITKNIHNTNINNSCESYIRSIEENENNTKKDNKIVAFFKNLWKLIKSLFDKIWGLIKKIFSWITGFFKKKKDEQKNLNNGNSSTKTQSLTYKTQSLAYNPSNSSNGNSNNIKPEDLVTLDGNKKTTNSTINLGSNSNKNDTIYLGDNSNKAALPSPSNSSNKPTTIEDKFNQFVEKWNINKQNSIITFTKVSAKGNGSIANEVYGMCTKYHQSVVANLKKNTYPGNTSSDKLSNIDNATGFTEKEAHMFNNGSILRNVNIDPEKDDPNQIITAIHTFFKDVEYTSKDEFIKNAYKYVFDEKAYKKLEFEIGKELDKFKQSTDLLEKTIKTITDFFEKNKMNGGGFYTDFLKKNISLISSHKTFGEKSILTITKYNVDLLKTFG